MALQFMRGSENLNPSTSEHVLKEGQPFYSKYNNQLYVGEEKTIAETTPVGAANIISGDYPATTEGLNAKTPKLTPIDNDDPIKADFNFEYVTTGKMNPRSGAVPIDTKDIKEAGIVVFGLGNTAQGRNNFIAGTRNYSNDNENTTFGQGNYNTGKYSTVTGSNNLLLSGGSSLIGGSNNYLTKAANSLVVGTDIKVDDVEYSLVSGRTNTITGNLYHSLVTGNNNTIGITSGTNANVFLTGSGNILKNINSNTTVINIGSNFNQKHTNIENLKIGNCTINIGHENNISGDSSTYATSIGNFLYAKNYQTVIGNYTNPDDLIDPATTTGYAYSIILSNGTANLRNNVLKIPNVNSPIQTTVLKTNLKLDPSSKGVDSKFIGNLEGTATKAIYADEDTTKGTIADRLNFLNENIDYIVDGTTVAGKATSANNVVDSIADTPLSYIFDYSDGMFTPVVKNASVAGTAATATADSDGNVISTTYLKSAVFKYNAIIGSYKGKLGFRFNTVLKNSGDVIENGSYANPIVQLFVDAMGVDRLIITAVTPDTQDSIVTFRNSLNETINGVVATPYDYRFGVEYFIPFN